MIKVLEEKPVPRKTIACGNCGSVLEYGNADLHIDGFYKSTWFECPVCGVKVVANWITKGE